MKGINRCPTTNISDRYAASFARVRPSTLQMDCGSKNPSNQPPSTSGGTCPPRSGANAGKRTRTRTIARSSMISQPTTIRPRSVSNSRRLQSSEHNDRARDGQCEAEHNARPGGPPHSVRQTKPECRHGAIWPIAPGMATALTESKSCSEKCSPTPTSGGWHRLRRVAVRVPDPRRSQV